MKQILLFSALAFFCFLLCGCNADYKIDIDENLNINEEISFSYDLRADPDPDMDYYSSALDNMKKTAAESNYEVIDSSNGLNINVLVKRKSNFDSFKSPVFSDIYTYYNAGCDEDKCSIISTAKKNDIEGDGMYLDYKISITVPYKVIKQNADEIDLKSNTYIWYYIVGGKQSNIELIFEKHGKNVIQANKRSSSIMLIIYIIVGSIILFFIGRVVYKIIRSSKPY